MLKQLKQNVINEMNKTVMDDNGLFVGIVNNHKTVDSMSILQIIKHNIRIAEHYKKA